MDHLPASPLSAQLAAALDWWRDAGVDQDFSDMPHGWLDRETTPETPDKPAQADRRSPAAANRPQAAAAPAAAPPALGGDPAGWPAKLEDFAAWWLAEPSLAPRRGAARVAPRGPQGARLMLLVPEPEPDDTEQLLSGPQGRLLSAMLDAMGIAEADCYIASALPCPVPLADWGELATQGLGAVLRRHISLVAPQRLLVFGQSILPLLGHDPAQSPQSLRDFNHDCGQTPMLASRALAVLLDKPRERAGFWRRWLEWTDTDG